MTDIKTIEGDFTSGKGKYALVVGRWNSFVVEHLLDGAIDTLRRHGVDDKQISIVRAPGAFEIPLVCQKVAAKGDVDAIIALGAVIRGGTMDRVVVDLGDGRFRSRQVRLGIESGDRIAIRSGLEAGENVVTSAQFLIDSESNIESALNRFGESSTEAAQ